MAARCLPSLRPAQHSAAASGGGGPGDAGPRASEPWPSQPHPRQEGGGGAVCKEGVLGTEYGPQSTHFLHVSHRLPQQPRHPGGAGSARSGRRVCRRGGGGARGRAASPSAHTASPGSPGPAGRRAWCGAHLLRGEREPEPAAPQPRGEAEPVPRPPADPEPQPARAPAGVSRVPFPPSPRAVPGAAWTCARGSAGASRLPCSRVSSPSYRWRSESLSRLELCPDGSGARAPCFGASLLHPTRLGEARASRG